MAAKGLRQGDTTAARAAQKGAPMTDSQYEEALTEDIGRFFDDPVGFVYYAFPWGQGELKDQTGPDKWQCEQLESIGARLRQDPDATIRDATASGHGIGKTTETSWIILWAMSTRPHLSGVVTANTMGQLSTKTWRELALWYKRSVNRHWFKWSATKFWHVQHPETWAVNATPNSEHNSEAFAGLHAKYVLMIFDEASAIPDKIWEVAEGAMTTPRAMWVVFGNPTKNTGRFKDCFGKDKKRWTTRHVDSRTCKMTNKKELDEWIEAYGLDSDFVRIRILGLFPRLGAMQFISSEVVDRSMLGEILYEAWCYFPVVIGVDVARYGDDKSCIAIRQGRKLHEIRKFRELNTMQLAAQVVAAMKDHAGAVAVFVDGVGVGAGVVDRLQMLGHPVIEVNGGETAFDEIKFYNKTSEMWDRMREWLSGSDLPTGDNELRLALTGREYYFDDKERIRLERKKDMKKRGLASPDEADALAHTFAEAIGDLVRNSVDPTEEQAHADPEF
jgi:hypothetical protein